jgi:ferrous iron transport protein B
MSYLSTGYMIEVDSLEELRQIFISHGWTWLTALCTMLFCLLHWPCTTTLLSAYKESGSAKWTFLAFLLPTVIGIGVCFIVAQTARLLGLV